MATQPTEKRLSHKKLERNVSLLGLFALVAVAIGGVVELWKDRGSAWGLLSTGLAADMPVIHRVVRRVIETSPLARIEAQVACGHNAGQRWVRMLGFEHEGVMRSFWNGRDYDLFARVK